MAGVLAWLLDHPGVFGDLAVAFLVLDRWVHRQQSDSDEHADRLGRLESAVTKINDEASERHSLIMARVMAIELDVRELRTILNLRKRSRD